MTPVKAVDRALQEARLDMVFGNQPAALAAAVMLAALTIITLAQSAPLAPMLAWFFTLIVLNVARAYVCFRYRSLRRKGVQPGVSLTNLAPWERIFEAGCLAAGLIWGSTSLLFFPTESSLQLFLGFVLAGVCAGAMSELAVTPRAALAFVVPCAVPLSIRFLEQGGTLNIAAGTMTLLYVGLIAMIARRGSAQLTQTVTSKLEAQASRHALSDAELSLRNAQEHLRLVTASAGMEAVKPPKAGFVAATLDEPAASKRAATAPATKEAFGVAPAPSGQLLLVRILAIAVAYAVAGKLGLLLAIPPGYATAIWPAAGIALGAVLLYGNRCWPGVWLGSFAANLFTSFDPSATAVTIASLFPPAIIGLGATAQALVGATLVRRILGFPLALAEDRQILIFYTLTGPIACLMGASIGVITLYLAGTIPAESAPYNWWTWWVGDTIGVLIFAPLMLMWLGGPAWRSRRGAVTLALAATFVAAVLVFIYTSNLEWQRLERRFREDATDLTTAIERRLDLSTQLLKSVVGLFAASERVDRTEFHRFAAAMLTERSDLQALEWIPRVSGQDRRNFQMQMDKRGMSGGIFERTAAGRIVTAERSEYFPVEFVEPYDGNAAAYGFDMSSEQNRRAALGKARDSGQIAATSPVELVQANGEQDGFLIFAAVYSDDLPGQPTVQERQAHLTGFAGIAIRARHLVSLALADRPATRRIRLQIIDREGAQSRLLYSSDTQIGTEGAAASASHLPLKHRTLLAVGGRTWELGFSPTLEYLHDRSTLFAWMVLAAGLLFSAAVGAGALSLTGRTAAVQAQVRERTAELARTNERLAVEIKESRKVERLKSEFVSTVSHELRTPLTSIRGSLGLLSGGAAGELPQTARPLVEIAYRNTDRLVLLINDILDMEKIEAGTIAVDMKLQALTPLLEQAAQANEGYARTHEVSFVVRQPLPMVNVAVDANRFLQVMANLLSNAAKFSPPHASIDISADVQDHTVCVRVRDRGAGIPEEFKPRIFQRFSQADASDSRVKGGTGLGLAICKLLIEQMRGTIGYEDAPGGGTIFFFTLPIISAGFNPAVRE